MLAARSVGWRSNTPSHDHAADRVVDGPVRHDELARARRRRRGTARSSRGRPTRRRTSRSRCRRGGTRPGRRPRRGAPTPDRASGSPNERPRPLAVGHRRGAEVHHARAVLEHPLELGDGGVRDRRARASAPRRCRSWYAKPQSSSSHRLNARSVAMVAGMSSRSACSMPHASVGNSSDGVEALLVHHREARVAVAVLGAQRLDLHQRPRVDTLGDLAAEHEVHAAGDDDRVERRVRDEAEELAAREQERVTCPAAPTCTPRRRNSLSRWRVHASSVS